MANDIAKQLERLRARRHGSDRLNQIAQDARDFVINKRSLREAWEGRAANKQYTRYALGAMQEVDPDYTRISIETAKRVENQLSTRLKNAGLSAEFRLQGSVPLNVHIQGVSDVDLLTIDTNFLVYDTNGKRSMSGSYVASPKNSISVLTTLRRETESALRSGFPAANIDSSGDKAIKASGGSLARPVDVVPSHWWDNVDYQASEKEHDRGIIVLNKSTFETIKNLSFLHIQRISARCDSVRGSLRKAIRLCKSVKADAEENGTKITLSSFDIGSAMYHADQAALILGSFYELGILAETQRHLDKLARDHAYAKTLRVPDNSRQIFDSPEKLSALNILSTEMDELLRQVAREQSSTHLYRPYTSLEDSRRSIQTVLI